MYVCLNPIEPHQAIDQTELCQSPQCGFLMQGAAIGRWQIQRLVNHQNTTDLYQATSSIPGEQMLVKVIRYHAPGLSDRLEPLQTLRHPHIHHILHMGQLQQEQVMYLVERYEAAGSLARLLKAKTRLPLRTIGTLLSQIAQALQHAHERRLVHGALKSENCLIVHSNHIQINDFYHGLLPGGTRPSPPTPYTAPEQLQGKSLPASDQYALAILASELMRLHLPSDDIRSGPLSPLDDRFRQMLTRFPVAIGQILATALNQDPLSRYPGILVFTRELQQALHGAPQTYPKMPSGIQLSPAPNSPQDSGEHSLKARQMPALTRRGGFQENQGNAPGPTRLTSLSRLPGHTEAVTLVRWTQDGQYLASASLDRTVLIWKIQQRIGTPLATLTGYQGEISALSWSQDGSLLATAGKDAALRIWKLTHTPTFAAHVDASWWGHDGPITTLEWSPNRSLLATGGKDQVVRLWDAKGVQHAFWQTHKRGVTALAWSPDGQLLATGGSDRQIHLWVADTKERLGSYALHSDDIHQIRWSPNGKLLASASGKKKAEIHLWEPRSGQCIAQLRGNGREIAGMFWGKDVSWFAAAFGDGTLRSWRVVGNQVTPSQPMELGFTPLAIDGSLQQKIIAVGTGEMFISLQQWNA